MKKLLFLISLCIISSQFSVSIYANSNVNISSVSVFNESIVSVDEAEIYDSFKEIDELVGYISNDDTTLYNELLTADSSLVQHVNPDAAIALNANEKFSPPIISAFLWGCLYGPLGIVVVAVTTNSDRDLIRQAANGCIVFHVAAAILYGLSYLLLYTVNLY